MVKEFTLWVSGGSGVHFLGRFGGFMVIGILGGFGIKNAIVGENSGYNGLAAGECRW